MPIKAPTPVSLFPERYQKYLNVAPSHVKEFLFHLAEWSYCTRCPLHTTRRMVVPYRGSLPCDVLFIGEAPGESEDAIGVPFIGPAGSLFDDLRRESWLQAIPTSHKSPGDTPLITWGITNILACIPRVPGEMQTGEIRPPHKEEAATCQPRLVEIIKLADPKLIVCLGEVAKRFFPKQFTSLRITATKEAHALPRWNNKLLVLTHPSRILRLQDEDPREASLLEKKFVLALSQALRGINAS